MPFDWYNNSTYYNEQFEQDHSIYVNMEHIEKLPTELELKHQLLQLIDSAANEPMFREMLIKSNLLGGSVSRVVYQNTKYIVRMNKSGKKYIRVKRAIVFLGDIRGKYRYVKS